MFVIVAVIIVLRQRWGGEGLGEAIEAIVGFAGELDAAVADCSGGEAAKGGIAALRQVPG